MVPVGAPRVRWLVPGLLVLAGALGGAPGAARADGAGLSDLVEEYESWLASAAERAYEGQAAALERIADRADERAQAVLRHFLDLHGRADRRRADLILAALVRRGGPSDLDHAVRWVERRQDDLLREGLHRALAGALRPDARAHLRAVLLPASTPPIKVQVIRALGARGDPGDAVALLPLLREEDLEVRVATFEALAALRADRALPTLLVFLAHPDWRLRAAAARAVGTLGGPAAWGALRRALEDAHPRVAEAAAAGLGRSDDLGSVPDLVAALRRVRGGDLRLEDAFVAALEALTGRTLGSDPDLWAAWYEGVKGQPYERPPPAGPPPTVEGARYYGFPVRSSRITFVVDVSRSMGWNGRLESAVGELQQVLRALPPSTRFNVIAYSDGATAWRPGLEPATPANVRRALAFVGRLAPDNGTNSYEALARAFADEETDTIYFLSDGHPSVGPVVDPEHILLAVRTWNRHRRVKVHGLALLRGAPPPAFAGMENPDRAQEFMRRLAAENDGETRVLR